MVRYSIDGPDQQVVCGFMPQTLLMYFVWILVLFFFYRFKHHSENNCLEILSGVGDGWHGFQDIVMTHVGADVQSTPESPGGRTMTEVKRDYTIDDDPEKGFTEPQSQNQLIVQTIFYSFLQKKKKKKIIQQ